MGRARIAHLNEREEGLNGCEGPEDVDIKDALQLGQLSTWSKVSHHNIFFGDCLGGAASH